MRLKYIDRARGICIALVVLGHICRRNWAGTIPVVLIYTVNVQAFFIISGILLEKNKEYLKDLKAMLSRYVRRLLIPYYVFETLYNFVYSAFNGISTFRWQEIDTLIFYGRKIATWFLPTLFLSKLFTVLLIKAGLHRKTVLSAAGALFIIGLFNGFLFPSYNSWQARFVFRTFIGIGFIMIGVLLSSKIENVLVDKKIKIPVFVLFFLTAIGNGQVSTFLLELNNPALYVISSICGTIVLLIISNLLSSQLLEFWGENSIIILGTHQMLLYVIYELMGKDNSVFTAVFLWAFVMLLEYPIIKVINKCAPWVIGKARKKDNYAS